MSEHKRNSIKLPLSPVRSREPSREPNLEPRSRSNSVARRDSIDVQAKEFANNCEKIAERHNTNKFDVAIDAVTKLLQLFKNN